MIHFIVYVKNKTIEINQSLNKNENGTFDKFHPNQGEKISQNLLNIPTFKIK